MAYEGINQWKAFKLRTCINFPHFGNLLAQTATAAHLSLCAHNDAVTEVRRARHFNFAEHDRSDDLVQHPSLLHQSCLINLGVVRPTAAHYFILIASCCIIPNTFVTPTVLLHIVA